MDGASYLKFSNLLFTKNREVEVLEAVALGAREDMDTKAEVVVMDITAEGDIMGEVSEAKEASMDKQLTHRQNLTSTT